MVQTRVGAYDGNARATAGRSSAWLEHRVWDAEVAGSNPAAPIWSQTAEETSFSCRYFARSAGFPPHVRGDGHPSLGSRRARIAALAASLVAVAVGLAPPPRPARSARPRSWPTNPRTACRRSSGTSTARAFPRLRSPTGDARAAPPTTRPPGQRALRRGGGDRAALSRRYLVGLTPGYIVTRSLGGNVDRRSRDWVNRWRTDYIRARRRWTWPASASSTHAAQRPQLADRRRDPRARRGRTAARMRLAPPPSRLRFQPRMADGRPPRPRSSADQSEGLLIPRSQVRILPGAP